jgi:hypothetical protein
MAKAGGLGNNAAASLRRLENVCVVTQVRHASYGGQTQFLGQVRDLYELEVLPANTRG